MSSKNNYLYNDLPQVIFIVSNATSNVRVHNKKIQIQSDIDIFDYSRTRFTSNMTSAIKYFASSVYYYKYFQLSQNLYYLNKISRQISKKTNLSNNYIDDFLFINNSYLLSDLQSIGMRYFLISNILHCVSIEDNYILSHEINQEVMTYINKSTS